MCIRDRRQIGRALFAGLLRLKFIERGSRRAKAVSVRIARCELKIMVTSTGPTLESYWYWIENATEMYRIARELVLAESGLSDEAIPVDCPFSVLELLDDHFLPDLLSLPGVSMNTKWSQEDERKSSERTLKDLLEHKEEFIERLGRERYDRAISELCRRLGLIK